MSSPTSRDPLPENPDDFLSEPTPGAIAAVAAMPGPVVVLGAGGKMGLHLCLMLKKAAHAAGRDLKVSAVSRFTTLHDRSSFDDAGIPTIACDLSVPAEVERLPDAPTVFFLAGVKFGTATSPDLLEKMNVVLPRLVANRYQRSRIVAFSTGCVYPFVSPAAGGAAESTPVAPVGDYAESCLRREEAFAEISRLSGTKVALIRLNYSVEFRYGVLVDIAAQVLQRKPVDVSTGYVNVIWQADALSQIIQTYTLANSPAVPVNITGAGVHRVRDLARRFGEILGVEPIIQGTEKPTAWLSNACWSHQQFGPPPTNLETMMQRVAAWLQAGRETWGKPTGFQNRDGKF